METKLSYRLQIIADQVLPGAAVADIGTDHGAIPLYLVTKGLVPFAVASDRVKTPVAMLRDLVEQHSLQEVISVRQGEGLTVLSPGEVDTVVITGMGGMTILEILEASPQVVRTIKRFVLSPQRDMDKVRRWLSTHALCIVDEILVFEDGYYYEVFVVEPGKMSLTENEVAFGPILLEKKPPLLVDYYQKKKKDYEHLMLALQKEGEFTPAAKARWEQLKNHIKQIDEVILCPSYSKM